MRAGRVHILVPLSARTPSTVQRMADGTAGRPSVTDAARYARQIRLAEVGLGGQARLAAASVLVVGAGGLGSPAVTYLAAAGVGTIGIVDDDIVEPSNLHRQPLHGTADVGRLKVESAAEAVAALNPDVRVISHAERFTAANASPLVTAYDVVVDGSDNLPTRYAVSAACSESGRPHVWAAALGFEAQMSVWWAGRGPCYACVFPTMPPPGSVPSCAEAGVMGALVGTVGSLQAMEALKILLGVGDPLIGRLLVHNALAGTWDVITVRADPQCASCGSGSPARGGMPRASVGAPGGVSPSLTMAEFVATASRRVIDVRPAPEQADLPGPASATVELAALRSGEGLAPALLGDRDEVVVFVCRTGQRSAEAAALAHAAGWRHATSLEGGAVAWRRELDSSGRSS